MIPVRRHGVGWVEDDGTPYEGEAHLMGIKEARIFGAESVSTNPKGKKAVLEYLWAAPEAEEPLFEVAGRRLRGVWDRLGSWRS